MLGQSVRCFAMDAHGTGECYYEVLGLHKNAAPPDVRAAYRNLVRRWHPDKHPESTKPEAEAHFKAITEAYEILMDQQENGAIFEPSIPPDQTLTAKKSGGIPASNLKGVCYSADNVVPRKAASLFSSSILRKPPPAERTLRCTLEELCLGCKKEVRITRDVVTKNGSIVKKEETVTVRVKPGYRKGTEISFSGMGDEQPGCLPADLVFVVSEKKHPVFKRVGDDLVLKAEVPLVKALTGWSLCIKSLSGRKLICSSDDEIIHPGYEKVFRGHGMPLANVKGMRGDLRVKFTVVFPTKLSGEQRSGVAELLRQCF